MIFPRTSPPTTWLRRHLFRHSASFRTRSTFAFSTFYLIHKHPAYSVYCNLIDLSNCTILERNRLSLTLVSLPVSLLLGSRGGVHGTYSDHHRSPPPARGEHRDININCTLCQQSRTAPAIRKRRPKHTPSKDMPDELCGDRRNSHVKVEASGEGLLLFQNAILGDPRSPSSVSPPHTKPKRR
jgi:hypothetical protein